MGLACSYIIETMDPDVFIVGGGVSRAGKLLTDAMEKWIDEYSHVAQIKPGVLLATLGNDAGTYGAAALAISTLFE